MVIIPLLSVLLGNNEIDPRGPVPGIQSAVTAGVVESTLVPLSPSSFPSRPGKAQWIWLNRDTPKSPIAAVFRKTIQLSTSPKRVRVWFSADAHARIYVNGKCVSRGPDDAGQDYPGTQTGHWFACYRDLTPFFREGINVIAAEVFAARAMEGRYNTSGRGGLLFEGKFEMPDRTQMTVESDASWRGIPSREWSYTEFKPGKEALTFDGAAEQIGWRGCEFDDQSWPECASVASNWPKVETSEIPARIEATYPIEKVERPTEGVIVKGNQATFLNEGSCAVCFDRVLSGFVGIRVRGSAGSVLVIQPNEPNTAGYNRMAIIRLRDGVQTVELPFYDSFSVVNLVVDKSTGPVEILDLRANFVAQPVRYEGSFACSDDRLNRIWTASRWLTQICQQTHHLDSPHHQEPICDPGDYLIISLNNYQAFGQPWLARQDLRKYAWLLKATAFRPFHTSYALIWLQMLIAYNDYTGDTSLVRELAPEVFDLLDRFAGYRGKNGLISEAPDYMFMDWVTIAGFGCHHPPAVLGQGYMTAFFYRALQDGIHVASVFGDKDRIAKYELMRRVIREAYNRELWDEQAGLYLDGKPFVTSIKPSNWLPADIDIQTHSAQNNALAVLYDLAPEPRQVPIMHRLMESDLNVQPYFMHFIFNALHHANLFNKFGAEQMRRWKIQSDTQSFREMWDTGDYSHAWQCTPLFQMSARVLGVTPSSPGFATVCIQPEPCDLTWAKGSIPTPHGTIETRWRKSPTDFLLEVKLPKGCRARLLLPRQSEACTVNVDGKNKPTKTQGSSVVLSVGSGTHRVIVSKP